MDQQNNKSLLEAEFEISLSGEMIKNSGISYKSFSVDQATALFIKNIDSYSCSLVNTRIFMTRDYSAIVESKDIYYYLVTELFEDRVEFSLGHKSICFRDYDSDYYKTFKEFMVQALTTKVWATH